MEVWLRGSSQVELRELVLDAARQLPDALCEFVELTLIDGLTDEEIAEHCGIVVTTVRGRRLRSVRAIREAINLRPPPRRSKRKDPQGGGSNSLGRTAMKRIGLLAASIG